ncbi:MAG: M1 family metallopeptidase [Bacteroidia bacterium]|nr:M1 family metallopeptidase [Bacteroidia bacterium]
MTFLFLLPLSLAAQNYFQQRVDYNISVKLDDKKNTLSAFEELIYTNNSNDTLSFIYFHLWPNGYSNTSTPMALQMQRSNNLSFFNAPNTSYGYIDSLDFKIDNNAAKWENSKDTTDICKLLLNEPLLPGKSITITTPFFVKIPGDDFSRLGHYGQSYQITQWYPKPAVYDMYGWHHFSYLNQGEFYSEFGKFDVSITLPENYSVAATGVLQNPEEIQRIENIINETTQITTYNKNDLRFPVSSSNFKTIRFVQDSIHDFAWFADKRFHILKGEVKLPNSQKTVTTYVYFTNIEGNLWKNAINYVNNGVYYYSKWIGNYPYTQCTAVESALGAGGGMEYPMITNIGKSGNAEGLENVIVHEVGHNWFYGILGSNEREHPWMDEGINSFYEQRYTSEIKNNKGYYGDIGKVSKLFGTSIKSPFDVNSLACDYIMRNGSDQALGLHSEKFLPENYGIVAYMKGANAMNYLYNSLGKASFDSCMMLYFNKWQFRHPYPADLQQIFNENSNKDINWFYTGILNNTYHSDYKIQKIKIYNNNYNIIIKNKGKLNSPVYISLLKDNQIIGTSFHKGFLSKKSFEIAEKDFDKIVIDPNNLMFEIKRTNNAIRTKGIFKKAEPLELRFLGLLENPAKTQLFYTPVIGWNTSDGLMPGLLFYNPFVTERKVQYRLMPMYGINSNKLTGIGYSEYNFYPGILNLQKISVFAEYNKFDTGKDAELTTWQKTEAGINILFKRNPAFPLRQWKSVIKSTYATDLYADSVYNLFINASLCYRSYSKVMPVDFKFNVESGPSFLKGWADCSWRINYKNRKTGFSARFFAGTFFYNNSNMGMYNFHVSGTQNKNDYSYSEVFPDRSGITTIHNPWSHQFIKNEGGFGIYTPIQSNAWMTSLNLEAAFPVPVPISLYFNIATYQNAAKAWSGSTALPYEVGIEFKVIPDIFVIYFPVKMSTDVKSTNELYTNGYTEKIRFTLNFSKLVPFKYNTSLPIMF